MKNILYFTLLIAFLCSCKQKTEEQPANQTNQNPSVNPAAGKLEDLTKIDTAAFLKENPLASRPVGHCFELRLSMKELL